jgi:putative transposase
LHAKPDTILAWYRKLIAHKFDGSKYRRYPGRPVVRREVIELILRMARENTAWGYDRIAGALNNLGHGFRTRRWAISYGASVSLLLRSEASTATGRTSFDLTWPFLAGIDFFTVEVLTWRGLATYYVLFFLHLETRRVTLAGITRHPTEQWMIQMARNAVDEIDGVFRPIRFVLHDRDSKFCASFRATLRSGGVEPLLLPARSPNLNAFAERWVRSVKSECLSKLILFGESSLRRAITQFLEHYHHERNHQGKANLLLFRAPGELRPPDRALITCRERLGGLLKYYCRAA